MQKAAETRENTPAPIIRGNRETADNRIFADLDISQMDDTSCFSESGKCFSKDEMLTYLNAEATVEAAS